MPSLTSAASRSLLPVARVTGIVLLGFSLAWVVPMAVSLAQGDGLLPRLALGLLANVLAGGLLFLLGRLGARREIRQREGFLLVVAIALALSLSAALLLWLCLPRLSYLDAWFESMSGFTTTGATILPRREALPDSLHLWRHQTSWLGGLGVIALAMAVLPLLGIGGLQVVKAESTGPVKEVRLAPRLAQTARTLWLAYAVLTLICALCLKAAGMGWLDAVCHAYSVLSLGGFSTRDGSIGAFNSAAVEGVVVVFTLIATVNFATHFGAWRDGSLKGYARDAEARATLVLLFAAVVLLAGLLWWQGVYADLGTALRRVGFNLVSVASTSGLHDADYGRWPLFAPLTVLLLSCIASSAGSTGGGIKMIRTLILFQQSRRELRLLLHPNSVQALKVGRDSVAERVVMSVLGFIHLYSLSVVGVTFLLLVSGLDLLTSFSAALATLNNVGPGLGRVGPGLSYAGLSNFQTFVCAVSMLLGRLEIFVLIVPFTRAYWRE